MKSIDKILGAIKAKATSLVKKQGVKRPKKGIDEKNNPNSSANTIKFTRTELDTSPLVYAQKKTGLTKARGVMKALGARFETDQTHALSKALVRVERNGGSVEDWKQLRYAWLVLNATPPTGAHKALHQSKIEAYWRGDLHESGEKLKGPAYWTPEGLHMYVPIKKLGEQKL